MFPRIFPTLLLGFTLAGGVGAQESPLAARVAPGDARLLYVGRFDLSSPEKATFSWSASTIAFRLNARRAEVLLGGAAVRYAVRVNGEPQGELKGGSETRPLEIILPATVRLPADVEVIRLNQPLFGVSRFEGVRVAAAGDLGTAPAYPARVIEFIGDSITAGHGNEAPRKEDPLETRTENVLKTYAGLTAAAFDAHPVVLAWSGIRLTSGQPGDVTMPVRWRRTVPQTEQPAWGFAVTPPQIVVINLGTNDFGGKAPTEAVWKADYAAFLKEVRERRPYAWMFVTNGPMLSADKLATLKTWTDAVVAERAREGDKRLRTLYFPSQQMADGIGGQWHPNVRTHAKMARQLTEALAAATGWKAKPVEVPPVPGE
jgi:lysophospholipase L1-like esterase